MRYPRLRSLTQVQKKIAIASLRGLTFAKRRHFMHQEGIELPVPLVPGALGVVTRNVFKAKHLKKPFDLIAAFAMGDWIKDATCSSYFDPQSPWFNVFYGAYGIKSYKPDGAAWGFHPDGSPKPQEIVDTICMDYNFLTAGELGCPPEKMSSEMHLEGLTQQQGWSVSEVSAIIPSALHRLSHSRSPNPLYYLAFGIPESKYLEPGAESYAPIKMRGKMAYKQVGPRTTLLLGVLCPDTPQSQKLLGEIYAALTKAYF